MKKIKNFMKTIEKLLNIGNYVKFISASKHMDEFKNILEKKRVFTKLLSTYVILLLIFATPSIYFVKLTIDEKRINQAYKSQLENSQFINNLLTIEKREIIDEKNEVEAKLEKSDKQYKATLEELDKKSKEVEEKLSELEKIKNDIQNELSNLPNSSNKKSNIETSDINTKALTFTPFGDENADSIYISLIMTENEIESETTVFENLKEQASRYVKSFNSTPSIWPVSGKVTSLMGGRSNPFGGKSLETHKGIDIGVPIGTQVKATANGIVKFSGTQSGYGYLVIISHENGIETRYAHNSKLLVKAGQTVNKGETIALSGNTGRSTGPHVHYEVRVNGTPQDPRKYIVNAA